LSQPEKDSAEKLLWAFHEYLQQQGLRSTRQRDVIVATFGSTSEHVSVEDLLAQVRHQDTAIGYATVYRTLKLLVEAGFAAERDFGDGLTRFEPRRGEHHDHMICEECGHIVEFQDADIERLQELVARRLGFELTRHRHELFGRCLDATCPRRKSARG
jgi:Fur family ferric uptake transcriptional regulator